MKKIRPLEMMILVFAVIILIASIFAVGYYGPELVNIIQREGVTDINSVFQLKVIISRIGEFLTQSFT
jgi:hypothetical protein